MARRTLNDFYQSLEFGKFYHKPANESWHSLKYNIDSGMGPYHNRFDKFKVHKLRGDMFCLECKCCGSIDK